MYSYGEVLARLLIGALMGGVIGVERETHGRPAGLRTHLLVSLSGVLIMLISQNHYRLLPAIEPSFVRVDLGRIVSGAITGVGFLGAGVIIKTRGAIYGLTTAACIWIVFAMGLAVGAGMYLPAVAVFVLTYFTLWILRNMEKNLPKDTFKTIRVTGDEKLDEEALRAAIKKYGQVLGLEYEKDIEAKTVSYIVSASFKKEMPVRNVLEDISFLSGTKTIKITQSG